MSDQPKRRPGRPPKYGEALFRREILVERETDIEAVRLAEKRRVAVTEIYREWIAKGRRRVS